MALEAVVGQDAAKIGMAREADAVEVVGFPLVPIGRRKYVVDACDGCRLVGRNLDPQPLIEAQRQQMVDDIEPFGAFGIVDAADVDQDFKLAFRIVAKLREDFDDVFAGDGNGQLVMCVYLWKASGPRGGYRRGSIGRLDPSLFDLLWLCARRVKSEHPAVASAPGSR